MNSSDNQTPTPSTLRPPGGRKKSLAQKIKESEQTPIHHGYFKTFDGTRLFYSIEGKANPNHPPLIFCYGLVCSSLHWTYQIEHFKKNYQTIWFDYRGHQNSELPKDMGSITIENIARDLATLMDELGIPKAVLLGHSMGVNVVLDFYRQYPERVSAMILANGTAQRPLETMFRSNAFAAGFKVLKRIYQFSPKLFEILWKSQPKNPLSKTLVALGGFNPHLTSFEDIELYVKQVSDMHPEIFLNLIANYEIYDANAWLHSVRCPTLVIAGDQDKMIPLEQQELMHQLIPGSKLDIIHHGSHCSQMDLPDLVNHKIDDFLAQNKL